MYRFLIVDDDPNEALQISYLIGTHFSQEAECEFASTRAEALEWLNPLKHKPFDATLLDLNLKDSRGPETFRSVHAASPSTPILLWSGRNDERGLRDLLIDEGAAGYLEKGNVTYKQIYEDLCDAARRAQTSARMPATEKHLLEDAERKGAAYVAEVRNSAPPPGESEGARAGATQGLEVARADAIQGLVRLQVAQSKQTARVAEDLGYVKGQLERLEERDREHDNRIDDVEKTGRHTAIDLDEVKKKTKLNHALLKKIAMALAIIVYALNEGSDLMGKVLPLLGFSP